MQCNVVKKTSVLALMEEFLILILVDAFIK